MPGPYGDDGPPGLPGVKVSAWGQQPWQPCSHGNPHPSTPQGAKGRLGLAAPPGYPGLPVSVWLLGWPAWPRLLLPPSMQGDFGWPGDRGPPGEKGLKVGHMTHLGSGRLQSSTPLLRPIPSRREREVALAKLVRLDCLVVRYRGCGLVTLFAASACLPRTAIAPSLTGPSR